MLVWWLVFAVLAGCGTWAARRYALARNLVDAPGLRRSHSVPTPRGGGIAIVVAVLVATILVSLRSPSDALLLGAFAGGLVAIAAVGFVDDHRPLSPWARLGVHAAAAVLFALSLQASGATVFEATAAFLACIALTNVWNFMDGINGIAASQALIVAGWLASRGAGPWAWLALALCAGCVGFLPFNFPRARIFLGDVGSGALGFALAALAFGSRPADPLDLLPLLLMLSAFLLDAGLTLLRRMRRGEHWWTAHTQHAYQVCSRRWGHAPVTVAYALWTAAPLAALAMLAPLASEVFRLYFGVAWYICGASMWLLLQAHGNGSATRTPKVGSNREGFIE